VGTGVFAAARGGVLVSSELCEFALACLVSLAQLEEAGSVVELSPLHPLTRCSDL